MCLNCKNVDSELVKRSETTDLVVFFLRQLERVRGRVQTPAALGSAQRKILVSEPNLLSESWIHPDL